MKDDKILKNNFTGINLAEGEAFEKIIKNQQEINQQMSEAYESLLREKDILIENQREIIVKQNMELEEIRSKN